MRAAPLPRVPREFLYVNDLTDLIVELAGFVGRLRRTMDWYMTNR